MGANDTAIRAEGVWKKYCRSLRRSAFYTLADAARGALALPSHTERLRRGEFWALKDIGFELKWGECLGVIGPNGAGKTTLLRVLGGMIEPDRGCVQVAGRVGSLIELGAGFHPQLTGRENILVNGTILGMSRSQIRQNFDAIVEFADIGDFLDSPVKFYSSGMLVRLGFAIAAHTEPDILLVDEVLAVGDTEFQLKCYNWVVDFRSRGKALVFVSHQEAAVTKHCDRALFLWGGEKRFLGPTAGALESYHVAVEQHIAPGASTISHDGGATRILSVLLRDGHEQVCSEFATGSSLLMDISYDCQQSLPGGFVAFRIDAAGGSTIFAASTVHKGVALPEGVGQKTLRLRIPELLLLDGAYYVTVAVNDRHERNVAYARRAALFRVRGPRADNRSLGGDVYMHHSWEDLI